MDGSAVHIDIATYHEAGHAVCALWHKRYVAFVAVSFEKPGVGLTWACDNNKHRNPFNPWLSPESARAGWEVAVKELQQEMRILLAGPVTEAKALGKPLRSLGANSDLNNCHLLAERFDMLTEFAKTLGMAPDMNGIDAMNKARSWTRRWVGNPRVWRAIESIAMQLSTQGILNAAQLGDIISVATTSGSQSVLQSATLTKPESGSGN